MLPTDAGQLGDKIGQLSRDRAMPMQWRVLPHLRTGARRRSVAQTRNSPSRTTLSSISRQPPWTLAGRQALCASTRSFGSSLSAGDCRERPSRGHSHSGRAKRACCSVSRARVRSRRAGQNGHLLDQLTFGTAYIWIILENVEGGPAIPQRWSACFSILPVLCLARPRALGIVGLP